MKVSLREEQSTLSACLLSSIEGHVFSRQIEYDAIWYHWARKAFHCFDFSQILELINNIT